jgi:DNA-binding transcriptional ArsR family regulator
MIMKKGQPFQKIGQTISMYNDSEKIEEHFGRVASLIGERSRAVMLWNLLDGRAYTASELAICAGISAQAASNHLSKLVNANLLSADTQGRHRYYRFTSNKIAGIIESIAGLLPVNNITEQPGSVSPNGIRYARTCYDHIAGKLGVTITNGLLQKKILAADKDQYRVTAPGIKWFNTIGIDIDLVKQTKRKFAYPCLDWSERKHHLGGALGAALLDIIAKNDWIRKAKQTREIIITGAGRRELGERLGLEL